MSSKFWDWLGVLGALLLTLGLLGEVIWPVVGPMLEPDLFTQLDQLAARLRPGLYLGPLVLVISFASWFGREGSVNLPDHEHIEWQFEVFEWLIERFPAYGSLASGSVATPTEEDFPVGDVEGVELGERLFEAVREHAGMLDWHCELVPIDDTRPEFDGLAQPEYSGAAGTFSVEEDAVLITYGMSGLSRPEALIATFAHELSHYLMFSSPTPPPGGEQVEELATDVCTVFLGFGIFTANSAFTYEGWTSHSHEGWQVQRQGYLDQSALATAMAIFVHALDAPASAFLPYLKTNPRTYFKQALTHLETHYPDRLAELRAKVEQLSDCTIEPTQW